MSVIENDELQALIQKAIQERAAVQAGGFDEDILAEAVKEACKLAEQRVAERLGEPVDQLVRRSEARAMCGGISKSTEYRLLSDPDSGWPRPVAISRALTGYSARELNDFIATRIKSRGGWSGP